VIASAGPNRRWDGSPLDSELRLLLALTRRLPVIRGSGRVGHAIARFYRRKRRPDVVMKVLDAWMRLNPNEYVEGDILFVPHLYDRRELRLATSVLREGDVMLDAGCNVGFYALRASQLVGPRGRVYAIDADSYSYERLCENTALNQADNVVPILAGLSDKKEILRFGVNLRGSHGASSFLSQGEQSVTVPCYPLSHFVAQYHIDHIRVAKFDIEGFGVRVLRAFFQDAPSSLYPDVLIAEKEEGLQELVSSYGYRIADESSLNWAFRRK